MLPRLDPDFVRSASYQSCSNIKLAKLENETFCNTETGKIKLELNKMHDFDNKAFNGLNPKL